VALSILQSKYYYMF